MLSLLYGMIVIIGNGQAACAASFELENSKERRYSLVTDGYLGYQVYCPRRLDHWQVVYW